ncbi:MAG TPA: hypothetical protein VER39_11935 [Nocardioidaceae bacterium]|nr:hypothetical protein [Nocardioidaceae bacterium]
MASVLHTAREERSHRGRRPRWQGIASGLLSGSRPAGAVSPARQDAVSARLAELHLIRVLLEEAVTLVSARWVQHGWFTTTDDQGRPLLVTAHNLGDLADRRVSGACLVGSVVAAGGGPAAVRSQLVQRTLDLAWHTLREDPGTPVRWCPPPDVRMAHVRDLTRWNDHPSRRAADVVGLLGAALEVAAQQSSSTRAAPA